MAVGLGEGENMAPFQNRGEQLCGQLRMHRVWEGGGGWFAGMVVKDE